MYCFWKNSVPTSLNEALDQVSENWLDPYDQFEKATLHAGILKWRSYSVVTSSKIFARERNLMTDLDVIKVYQRLNVKQRFLGPIYRKSLKELSPDLANVIYSNIGTSAYSSPAMQAFAMQMRQLLRANKQRLKSLFLKVGFTKLSKPRLYGSYSHPIELAYALVYSQNSGAMCARKALLSGTLVQSNILDANQITQQFMTNSKMNTNQALSLIALATLEVWLEKYPGTI